jgi:hypothetical protein
MGDGKGKNGIGYMTGQSSLSTAAGGLSLSMMHWQDCAGKKGGEMHVVLGTRSIEVWCVWCGWAAFVLAGRRPPAWRD